KVELRPHFNNRTFTRRVLPSETVKNGLLVSRIVGWGTFPVQGCRIAIDTIPQLRGSSIRY
ncbi:MAG: hypothetical protein AAF939_16960, partial [Planctomycetota bacterium]